MRSSKMIRGAAPIFAAALLCGIASSTSAALTFSGNGASGFGGTVGGGSVSVSDSGPNITFTFNPSGGFTGNDLVLYIDSVAGGYADTSTFFDNGDAGRTAVSGANTGNPSQTLAVFPAGFGADYALEFENTTYTGLFGLVAGGNNSLNYVTGAAPSGGTFSVTFPIADLGLSTGQSFSFVGSLISTSAYRSNETIGASVTIPDGGGSAPNAGFNGQTIFSSSDSYTTGAVPEPSSIGLLMIGAVATAARRSRKTTV